VPSVSIVPVPGGTTDVFVGRAGGEAIVVVESRDGRRFATAAAGGGVALSEAADAARAPDVRRGDMLPDGEVATGTGIIAKAYLTGPTRRSHGSPLAASANTKN